MNKMKVCIVSREYPPETLWGGIGTFTYNLAHGLKNIGHEVDVVCFTLQQDATYNDDGIKVHRISSPKIPFLQKNWWNFARYSLFPFSLLYSYKVMKKITSLYPEKQYDVVDFPEHIGEGFFSILFQRWPSLVRLYTPLSLIGELGLKRSTNIIDYFLFGLMERFSINNATIVNSPSQNLADLVTYKFKYDGRIRIIYNPIDTEKFAPANRSKVNDKTVHILFAGRLEDRKGVHILARAIPAIVKSGYPVQFTLLGRDSHGMNGVPSMKEYITNMLQSEGGLDKVKFIDPVPYHLLVEHYQQADIMVVPSLYDNSPYTCLEAMSCGVPVVGTSAGGMPEYIDDGKNGIIVPPNNPGLLAAAILDLLKHPQKRKKYGIAARDKVVSVFNREIIAKEITELYAEANKKYYK